MSASLCGISFGLFYVVFFVGHGLGAGGEVWYPFLWEGASSSGVCRGLSMEQGSTEDGRVICCGDNGLSNCICVGFWVGMCVGYLG